MKFEDGDVVVSIPHIAELLNFSSVRSVSNLVKKGMPFIQKGKVKYYRVKECLEWAYTNGVLVLDMPAVEDEDLEELPPSIRKDLADARLKELKLEKEKDEVVEKIAVIKDAVDVGIALRDNLMSIPDRVGDVLAVETNTKEVIKVLKKEIRQSLEDITSEFME